MIYKDFQGLRLPALGMGAMRLPVIGGDDAKIDEAAAAEIVAYAMANGVNYFDTGWFYHGWTSETVLGRILDHYSRDSYYLTTKFPGNTLDNLNKVEEIFQRQLEKTGKDYFDFYLLHNVYELNAEAYLDPKYGLLDFLLRQKEAGRIRHLGFSTHGSPETIARFLDGCGQHMEFGQIQLNWLDWSLQNAEAKVKLLRERGLPIWVMEPLRGGKLLQLPERDVEKLRALRPEESLPGWGFRFLQSIPGITMVLSGFSTLAQAQENIRTFSEEKPLSPAEWEAILSIAGSLRERALVPCTACRYCTAHCPQGLDIPRLLELYNDKLLGGVFAAMGLRAIPESHHPKACIGCQACESFCPQQIPIAEAMSKFAQLKILDVTKKQK